MPLLDVLFSILWLFLFIAWIFLVVYVFLDIFRSDDMSGWAKAGWVFLVLILPLFGVLIYVIARGDQMQERSIEDAKDRDAAQREYIREAAGTSSTTDELSKLADLREQGVITDEQFAAQKAKLLA
ncbi:MAG: SHOCT domain-containing protein [Ilumatobacteraceae bacterium]